METEINRRWVVGRAGGRGGAGQGGEDLDNALNRNFSPRGNKINSSNTFCKHFAVARWTAKVQFEVNIVIRLTI